MKNLNGIKSVPSQAVPANSGQSRGGSEGSGRPRASGSNGTSRNSTGLLLTRDGRWGWEKVRRPFMTLFLYDPYFCIEFSRCSCGRCRKLCPGRWSAPTPGIGRSMTTARSPSTSTSVCVARWSWCWVSSREPEGVCKKRTWGFRVSEDRWAFLLLADASLPRSRAAFLFNLDWIQASLETKFLLQKKVNR